MSKDSKLKWSVPLKKRIIYALGTLVDKAGDFVREIEAIKFNPYAYLYFGSSFYEYKKETFKRELREMQKAKYIKKVVDEKGRAYFEITARGFEFFSKRFPLSPRSRSKWDKRWRLVIFDIPEKERNKRDDLREKLLNLGFGMWQQSVYISPYDLKKEMNEFLEELGLSSFAVCLEAKAFSGKSDQDLVIEIWKLQELADQYEDTVARFELGLLEGKDRPEKKKEVCQEFHDHYFQLLESDPLLPWELLPDWWPAERVKKTFIKSQQIAQTFSSL